MLDKEVAESLEVDARLLPYIPELLADLWALGSYPELIVELLKSLGLSAVETSVLDLGCGKGAVSVLLAKELGFQILGIDAFRPFIEEAKKKATDHGIANLCEFRLEDMKETVEVQRDFRIVVYASIGGLLGSIRECVGKLRNTVASGGYMVIDDGFLKKGQRLSRKGYEHYVPHEETIRQLESQGDVILREVCTEAETRQFNTESLRAITNRANNLSARYAEVKDLLEKYVEGEILECEIINENISGAIWLIQKRDKPLAV